MRIRLLHLIFVVTILAIVFKVCLTPIEKYAENGLHSDVYVKRVVLPQLNTLPELSKLSHEQVDKHLQIESERLVSLPSFELSETWVEVRLLVSPSYILFVRYTANKISQVDIRKIDRDSFDDDKRILQDYVSPELMREISASVKQSPTTDR